MNTPHDGINELLRDHRHFHSEFQLSYFVVKKNSYGSEYGAYKQVLRELSTRQRSLRDYDVQLRELMIRYDELVHERPSGDSIPLHVTQKFDLELEKTTNGITDVQCVIEDLTRELRHLEKIAWALKVHIGELTEERRAALERDFRLKALRAQVAAEVYVNGRVSVGSIETLACLEPTDQKFIIEGALALKDMDLGEVTRKIAFDGEGVSNA